MLFFVRLFFGKCFGINYHNVLHLTADLGNGGDKDVNEMYKHFGHNKKRAKSK